jgi:hypothetical protein
VTRLRAAGPAPERRAVVAAHALAAPSAGATTLWRAEDEGRDRTVVDSGRDGAHPCPLSVAG